jgi:cation diffusion facilitator CzcD-associated flavoprotein CzcO
MNKDKKDISASQKEIPFFDVIIVGAGISGIAAAYHIQHKCARKKIAVLEARSAIGGTWDLFKYPGIRSDSDMYTLGFSFNPWKNPKAIADGPDILEYVRETANKFGIDKKIKFNHTVTNASWEDEQARWTITIAPNEKVKHTTIQCGFLFMCSGYYDYKAGYTPTFPNMEAFKGIIIHPQQWDTSLSYENKKVVVIGSGATAVTLVPEMAKKAQKVTMLQRSPTYIINLPSKDVIADTLRKNLPEQIAHDIVKWKNVLLALGFYNASKKWPRAIKGFIQKGIQRELGDAYNKEDFNPSYNPWDQRLCLIPDSDLFKALKEKKAEIVTDTIEKFTEKGILLSSGKELEADIIVTATGLVMQLLGGMKLQVNGRSIHPGEIHCYQGVLLSEIPNFAIAIGYTNASWTLKCDLNCHFVTRILNYMDKNDYSVVTPRFDEHALSSEPLLDLNSGYIQRAENVLPKQGSKAPWKVHQNYLHDKFTLTYGSVKDRYLEYR